MGYLEKSFSLRNVIFMENLNIEIKKKCGKITEYCIFYVL